MKVNKIVLIFIIALIVFSIAFLIYNILSKKPINQDNNNPKKIIENYDNANDSINNQDLGNDSLTSIKKPAGGGGGGGGGGDSSSAGGAGSDSPTIDNPPQKTLPSDIESKPCGFYTEDYGVCTGTCPEGICTTEGRSCYCKII